MFRCIRKYQKGISVFFLITILVSAAPTHSFALTSGPSQPEVQQFSSSSNTDLVDPFTGDFSYNIPLMDVGGYPININYAAGITPDQEASWVGLGWNLNVGAINRSVRGIPDDFAGDEIITEHTSKPNQTFGLTISPPGNDAKKEFLTFQAKLSQNFNISYNTYNGFGFSYSYSPSLDIPLKTGKDDSNFKLGVSLVPSLSLSVGSESGVGITPSAGLKTTYRTNTSEATLDARLGFPFSSREGAKGLSLGTSFNYTSNPLAKFNAVPDEKNGGGFSTSGFKGFATQTYPTKINFDTYSVNATLNITPEKIQNILTDKSIVILGGYYNGQFDRSKRENSPSYGFMYEGLSENPESVMDFNREKDGGYNENTTNMPVTNHTYDIFTVQGEGIGGSYRLFRGDVVTVGDNIHNDEGISPDLALNGGYNGNDWGGLMSHIKVGVDFKYIQSKAQAGRWSHNRVQKEVNPLSGINNSIQENVFFKRIGDMAPENNMNYYRNTLLEDDLYEYKLHTGEVTGEFLKKDGSEGGFNKNGDLSYLRTKRRNRNESFSYLTASKATQFALTPIYNHTHNDFSISNNSAAINRETNILYHKQEIPRITEQKKSHHLSEIKVTNSQGKRYVYGIPVYNNDQQDVTFSVNIEDESIDAIRSSGLVDYDTIIDASLKNKNGIDHYYQKTQVPAHASSYLLNYILSSDYVDSDGIPGPSDNDLGTYVKFNYSRTSETYQWRTPYEKGKANFADGLAGKREDDKASYSYGTKEIWYLHSIETRTHIAEFHLKDRLDGLGVKDDKGGVGTTDFEAVSAGNRLKCIDRIDLFAKPDKLNGKKESLKTVHFDYNYSLCPETPNSLAAATAENGFVNKGKLTLKKVWFTYGNSNKGVLNPYEFDYADTNFDGTMDVNFPYSSKNYDRWGVFKAQQANIGNEAFPYTLQNKTLSDQYAAAYSMTRIFTPTGGEMRIHYESDDYGFVQDKQAMRMYTIKGVSNSKTGLSPNSEELYGSGDNLSEKRYLHIDLGEGFTVSSPEEAKDYFIRNYLGDIRELNYKIKIGVVGNKQEWVTGYCGFEGESEIEVLNEGGTYKTGVIKLKAESLNGGFLSGDLHPFVKNGWLYAKLHYGRELMGSSNAEDNGFLQVVGAIASSVTSVLEFIFGFRLYMKTNGHSKQMDASQSFVRLYEHDKIKLGGGHRVKAIVMLDRWNAMLSDQEKNDSGSIVKEQAGYGQVYTYTMPEDVTQPQSRLISSGVAAYEPIIGGEENPIRKLVKTTDEVPLAPDLEYYSETPYGESFFPAPSIGYRKVRTTPIKVINEQYDVETLQSNGTGYVENEFFTAFDFPTRVSQTSLKPYIDESSSLNPLKIKSHDYVYCSQGYRIELNDMHGKPKSVKVMPDGASGNTVPVSLITYEYQLNATDPTKIDSKVPLVGSDLNIISTDGKELGTTVEVVNDTRFYHQVTSGGGADVNVRISFFKGIPPFIPPFIIPIISAFPDINIEETIFSSITTTKVVNRYGVLTKTITQDYGQTITSENLAWDEETGDVLLSRVENEYGDQVYNFAYPAHWAYQEMGLAYQNEGLEFSALNAVADLLIDGDEIICTTADNQNIRVYYHKIQNQLLKKDGSPVSNLQWGKVVRSGARNVAMTPVSTVSCLENPVVNNKIDFTNAKVLSAGAVEFENVWKGFCNCGEQSTALTNPFITGEQGQLRPLKNLTYLTERTQQKTNGELNVRNDGYFTDFVSYWVPGQPFLQSVSEEAGKKWQFITQIENYNPLGLEIENKDALNRFSMAQYGYGRRLEVATANNSQYRETAFDGFEDYDYGDCNDDHFSWRIRQNDAGQGVVDTESHTGRNAYKVPANSSSKIIKIIDPCD